ncbi:coiled-coil domain-containing protein 106-like isoform X2 [Gadus chalcogrammus]|uniref:coiled-coil domain-containing protein 106-like isoform X2 n=1 Tax=Gadus chalcogrammus TaxID=1042646 RepID=UPI0024C20DB7|nr:coiled-coil domain-containing protein 106-like isoform X2 [Gadus chalcogrammus]
MPTAGKVQWKKRSEELQTRIELLEEENALLKQQLEQRPSAEQGDTVDNTDPEPESNTDASSSSSTDSDSSSSSSSSSDGRKKKRKHKKKAKKRSKKSKKSKKSKAKGYRVTTISDVVKRYRQVLRIMERGHTMSRAFAKAGVSRNAVKDTAAIAELYIADRSVLEEIKGKKTLLHLSKVCDSKIVGELSLKIDELKKKKKLIPFTKRG